MEYLTREQLKELEEFDTPTVCNAIEMFHLRSNVEGYMKPGLILRTQVKRPVVGYAATAKVSAGAPSPDAHQKLMEYYEHVREMRDPTIAVVQDIDPEPIAAFWGEVQATVHMSLGCTATLMEGGVRDIEEANALGFHFFSTEINVAHGYTHVERVGCPIKMLGLEIQPGDLLHADQHGVVKIPHEIAPKLAEACRKITAAELPMLEPCRQAIKDGRKPTMEELDAWRRAMTEARKG